MLIATKPFVYANRRMQAGDQFEPRNRADRRLLIAMKRARPDEGAGSPQAPTPSPAPAPTPTPAPAPAAADSADAARAGAGAADPGQVDERVALREQYKQKTGRKPFAGWDAETLRKKISEA